MPGSVSTDTRAADAGAEATPDVIADAPVEYPNVLIP
jgi:hypothetical protein